MDASHVDFPMLEVGGDYVLLADHVPVTGAFKAAQRGGAYSCDADPCARLGPAVTADEREVSELARPDLLERLGAIAGTCFLGPSLAVQRPGGVDGHRPARG